MDEPSRDRSGSERPVYAVVLAGGVGRRFWPASRPERPKQLLPLGSDGEPLVAEAVERAARVAGADRVRLVAGAGMVAAIRELLPRLTDDNFLVEPTARGTGPALAWAARSVQRSSPGAVMVSLHADHRIGPAGAFDATMERAVRAAARGERLFCIGARPDRPETGYGYVRTGDELEEGVFEVREFVEKPSEERAREYLASGEYLWNTGLFAWRVDTFLDVVREETPEIGPALGRLEEGDVEGYFEAVEPVSVDVGVMERAPSVGAVAATFGWDDLGVWPALARALASDEDGNTVVGPAVTVEAGDNVVWSEDGRLVLFGVEGLVVARSGGQTLVTTREHAPRLKRLLSRLEELEDGTGPGESGTGG